MNDPQRLLDGGLDDEIALSALREARSYRASEDAKQRALDMVTGLAVGAAVGTAVSGTGSAVSRLGWFKSGKLWLLALVVGAGAVLGGMYVTGARVEASVPVVVGTGRALVARASELEQHAPAPAPADPLPAAEPEAEVAPPPKSARALPSASAKPRASLADEVAALDRAKRALDQGEPESALSGLEKYDAQFRREGKLGLEATALRIEALVRAGKLKEAKALAARALARSDSGPYADRIRRSIARAEAR